MRRLHGLGLALLLAALPLHAQEASAEGGGFFARLFGNDKTVLEKLSGKPYQVSNQAIGPARDLLNQRASGYGLVQMDNLQQYANGVLDKLKQASGIPGLPGTVYLLATDDLSAVTTADANIYVSYRWFENLNQAQYKRGQEDCLAALLAHELGHVALGHHNSDWFSNLGKWGRKLYSEGVALKLALDKQTANTGVNVPLPENVRNNMVKMQLIIEVTDRMLHPAWKRGQEEEADAFAVDLTRKAGYSYQEGMKRFLEINNSAEQIQIDKQNAKVKAMQAEVDLSVREGKLDQAMHKAGSQLLEHLGTALGAAHPDPAARTKALNDYVTSHYKSDWYEDMEAAPSTQYRAVALQKKNVELFDLYNTVFEHESLITSLKPEDLQKAIALGAKMTRKLGSRSINQDNWLIYYEYYRALAFGSAREAEAPPAPGPEPARKGKLAKAAARPAAPEPAMRLEEVQQVLLSNAAMMSFKPYEDGINLALQKGRRDEALNLLALTDKKFELVRSTLPKTITFYARAGKPERAQELVKYCANTYIDASDECASAAKL